MGASHSFTHTKTYIYIETMRTTVLASSLAAPAAVATAYAGFNYGATDLSGATRGQSSYEEEFNAAKNLPGTNGAFSSARLYTSLQGDSTDPIEAIAAAVNTETSLLLGIWVSGNPNVDNEINAIKAAVDAHGDALVNLVAGISVGSEDVYRITDLGVASGAGPGVSPQGIADYVNQVRSGLEGTPLSGKPVGHVDTYNTFANSSGWMAPVIEAVDFIGMNGFPYFEDTKPNSIEKATRLSGPTMKLWSRRRMARRSGLLRLAGHHRARSLVRQRLPSRTPRRTLARSTARFRRAASISGGTHSRTATRTPVCPASVLRHPVAIRPSTICPARKKRCRLYMV